MVIRALIAFLHFAAAFGIVSTLFYERITFKKDMTWAEARRIQLCDIWYGVCAGIIILAGLLRVFYFEKGSAYYFSNPFFLIKLFLFALIGVMSIYPTLRFLGWRNQTRAGKPPVISDKEFVVISRILDAELGLLVLLILCASFMAKGITLQES